MLTFRLIACGIALLGFMITPCTATTISWVGGMSSDWHTAGNWSPAQVPGAGDVVSVTSNSGAAPAITSADVQITSLTLNAPVTLTLAGGRSLALRTGTLAPMLAVGSGGRLAGGGAVRIEPSYEGYLYMMGGAVADVAVVVGGATTRISLEVGTGTGFGGNSSITVAGGAELHLDNGTVTTLGDVTVHGTLSGGNATTFDFKGASFVNDGVVSPTIVHFSRPGPQSVSGAGVWKSTAFYVTSGSTTTLAGDVAFGDTLSPSLLLGVTGTLDPGGHTLTMRHGVLGVGKPGAGGAPDTAGTVSGTGVVRTWRECGVWLIAGLLDVPLVVGSRTPELTRIEDGTLGEAVMGANAHLTVEGGAELQVNIGTITTLGDVTVHGTLSGGNATAFDFKGTSFVNDGVVSPTIVYFSRPGPQSVSGAGVWKSTAFYVTSGSTTTLAGDVAFGDTLSPSLLLGVTGTLDPGGHTLTMRHGVLGVGKPGASGAPDTAGTVSGTGVVRTWRECGVWLISGLLDVPLVVGSRTPELTRIEDGTLGEAVMGANAHLTVESGAELQVNIGTVTTLGDVTVHGTLSTATGTAFDFRGASLFNDGVICGSRMILGRSGTQSVSGPGLWGSTVSVAAGSSTSAASDLSFGPGCGARIEIEGSFDLGPNSLLNQGVFLGTAPGARLTGGGTLTSHLIPLSNQGLFSPGPTPSRLVLEGDLVQEPRGTVEFDIAGRTPVGEYDRLVVTGAVTLRDTVSVRFGSGFVPVPGDRFPVMSFGSRSGTFDTIAVMGLPRTLKLATAYDDTSLVLEVAADPGVSVVDAVATEGDAGSRTLDFTVTRSEPVDAPVTVSYATADGTATAGSDYVEASGALLIPADSLTGVIHVQVTGDSDFEAHEVFHLRLTGASGGIVEDADGAGTLLNDDPHPLLRDMPVTNASVRATARSPAGDLLYVGGDFTRIGPMVGNWVALDSASARVRPPTPLVTGTVRAAAPDGAGGWFIGGDFTAVMGVPRLRLAHLLAGGGLSEWNPGADGSVYALSASGSVVYAGGLFRNIGGQARNAIAAIDATSGLATDWNPDAGSGMTLSLAVSGPLVYAGGAFTSIGGLLRNNIAALSASTGAATAWNPDANSPVHALLVRGPLVYAGGYFLHIGGQTRRRIAAIDSTTGLATTWNPNADQRVVSLALRGSTVLAGGSFSSIGGQSRARIAALDSTTGLATAWNPIANGDVNGIVPRGGIVFLGGLFTNLGGTSRSRLAAVDAESGVLTAWDPRASNAVYTLASTDSTLFAGGAFASVGASTRRRLAAIEVATGAITRWDPNSDSTVYALAVNGGVVYAGGLFSNVGGAARKRIAALDAATGAATAWDPQADGTVYALTVLGSRVYAGGSFGAMGGVIRDRLAALDATTGALAAWDPKAGSQVNVLVANGATVYAAGYFSSIGLLPRAFVAEIDTATGLATTWDPSASNWVLGLVPRGTDVFVGGDFNAIGGQSRSNIAALSGATGAAAPWNPGADGQVNALAWAGQALFAGGAFTSIGGAARQRLAALDVFTGAVDDWDPRAGGAVNALVANAATVFAGGDFTSMAGLPQSHLAALVAPSGTAVGMEERPVAPGQVFLAQSYPNPARGGLTIRYGLARPGPVSLRIHDISGRVVRVLLDGERPAGWHNAPWDRTDAHGARLAAGLYFYELRASGVRLTRKLVTME